MSGEGTVEKIRENRVRRMAQRQGLALHKSRRRDRRAIDYGVYWLVDATRKDAIMMTSRGATLDAIEAYLMRE